MKRRLLRHRVKAIATGKPLLSLATGLVLAGWAAADVEPVRAAEEINPPLGPYVHLNAEHFVDASTYKEGDRIVTTPYFYWYDSETGAHLVNPDGSDALTDHPVTLDDFTYRSVDWHERELRDMMDAGIQVVLPVYWGEPSQRLLNQPVSKQPWSYAGIPPLVAARLALEQEGLSPPRIGMFYDTSTFQYNNAGKRIDLTIPEGHQWFYESVRDFFSLIPPRHWAMVDGRPIVFLYSAGFALRHDQSCIDYLEHAFARDFGGRVPYVVREISWQVSTAQVYAWGGALGLKNPGVASLGPGYDHSAVPGREPLVVARENGDFFERNWIRFLRRPSPMVFIETWNEFHEGTDIAHSAEFGRQYLELNRKFTDMFHQGIRPPLPRGPFSDVKRVSAQLQDTNLHVGLVQLESLDGVTEPTTIGSKSCRATVATPNAGRYIYFRIEDSFKWADQMEVRVDVEYFDSATGSFIIQYDGSDLQAPFQGAYTSTQQRVHLGGTRRWLHAQFTLDAARLMNSQNGGADFRISLDGDVLYVCQVTVERLGLPEEAGATLPGFQHDFADPLDESWQTLPSGSVPRSPAHGMLTLPSTSGGVQQCIPTAAGMTTWPQEILARVRISRPPASGWRCGGVLLGADLGMGEGIALEFKRSSAGERTLVLDGAMMAGPSVVPVNWQANEWYWLRLRHEPAIESGAPDIFAKVWVADGETVEPEQWLVEVDYYPAKPVRSGYPGLVGPGPGAETSVECDYLLVRRMGCPEVLVRLPAGKAARASLSPGGTSATGDFILQLHGSPEQSYQILASSDLTDWDATPVTTDRAGWVEYLDPLIRQSTSRLYRAQLLD